MLEPVCQPGRPRPARRLLGPGLALAASLLALAHLSGAVRTQESDEVRALWVTRASLTSPAAVAAMVRSAQAGRFNTVLLQVRGRGDAYFSDGLEPRASSLAGQPQSFDPLATALKLAHEQRIKVHAWINVNLVSSAFERPVSRAHLVYQHPEWLMVPRDLAREMEVLDPRSQLYLEKLSRWVRQQASEVEGLYLSPIPEAAAAATVSVVADIVARYAVDGVHLDYVRYPSEEFDYSREALLAFREDVLSGLPAAERRRREAAVGADLIAWTDGQADRWLRFRRDRLTALVGRVRASVKSRRPTALFSAAVLPDATEASARRLQDWESWLQNRLLDVACPMAYATDATGFAAQLTAARQAAGSRPVWAGIGAYRLSTSQTVENIEIARRLGASGVVLFSYDTLAGTSPAAEYLEQVGRAAFVR